MHSYPQPADPTREVSPTASAGSGPGWNRSIAALQRMVGAVPTLSGLEATLASGVRDALAAERAGTIGAQEARRQLSRAVQDYVQAVFLADLAAAPRSGVAVVRRGAIDLDGVLERDPLGFPYLTPVAARALRALLAHGTGLVLATGRSLSHVLDRCQTYGLAGGVAEYGSVIYDHRRGLSRTLVPSDEWAALGRIRALLASEPGVEVDPGYAYVARAFEPRQDGPRRGLSGDLVAAMLEAAMLEAARPAAVRVSAASTQTDFVAGSVHKGTGLLALAAELGWPQRLDFAIGDSVEDLPMLRMASFPFAPANAEAGVGEAGIDVMAGGFQHGFAEAVGHFLGHPPGSCPVCRLPEQGRVTRRVLSVLGIPDR